MADEPSNLSEKEKMLAGEFYNPADAEIQNELMLTAKWLANYNSNSTLPAEKRQGFLLDRFGTVGRDCVVRSPFHCDYGFNIHLGDHVFLNFNCVILDVVSVSIGDGTQIGPGVQIIAADHPKENSFRIQGLEFGRSVQIGNNVWIGAGSIILPGIKIGDNAIIGAGSVVTRDVPEGKVAFGNPARIQ